MAESLFWADQIAREIVERSEREKRMPNIKCQQTPSGAKHIGNLNDVIRAYFPYKALQEKKKKATFVHTTDDRDPLKDIPLRLPDLEGVWHETKNLKDMRPYLGMPLCRIPDPFGCCKSWSGHFTKVWMDGVYSLGIMPELHSVNKLYQEGKFEPYIKIVFDKRKKVGEIVAKFQRTKDIDYIPFDAICPNCGRLTNVDSFDIKSKKVSFVCGGKAIKTKRAEGCGFKGDVPWVEGKLQWRFEWPALWGIFRTTYEPFGKDHYEGSWKSGIEIAKEIYEIEPPIPFVYEFFLVNNQKMSASVGNVYIVQDMLRIMEPEVFLYFYTKKPGKQRNLDLANINLLVEDFENAEKTYFSDSKANTREVENIKRSYEMCMKDIPKKNPVRIPYIYASMIYQCHGESTERIIEALKSTGHIGDGISKQDIERIKTRIRLAGNWANTFADERYRFGLKETISDTVRRDVSKYRKALLEFAGLIEKKAAEKDIENACWDISNKNNMKPKEFFESIYLVLLGKKQGPRLAPFILTIGPKRVSELLRQI